MFFAGYLLPCAAHHLLHGHCGRSKTGADGERHHDIRYRAGWGLRPDGSSALGPTHGSVVVDKDGNIYTSANKGVVVFTPEGKVVQEYLGENFTNIHDMEIRVEGDAEFIYGARNYKREGIKFNAHTGEIVLRLKFPRNPA